MSEPVAVTPQQPDPVAGEPIALDRVMLAMDVVDTLRHQRELVERELDGERRQRELVERVQQLYESQGIDVPADVVAEGVHALEQDRFVYRPPERTFAVRLAEVYVERGKWSKRAAVVLLLVGVVWGAIAIPRHVHRQGLVDRYTREVARVVVAQRDLQTTADSLQRRLATADGDVSTPAGHRLVAEARGAFDSAAQAVVTLGADLQELPPGDDYPDRLVVADEQLAGLGKRLDTLRGSFGAVRGLLDASQLLGVLQVRLASALARLDGVTPPPSPSERAELDSLRSAIAAAIDSGDALAGKTSLGLLERRIDGLLGARQQRAELSARVTQLVARLDGVKLDVESQAWLDKLQTDVVAALAAGDVTGAAGSAHDLEELVEQLDQSYELRIVSRPGVQSGVWRYLDGDQSRRNYYIIVEAFGQGGQVLTLPIVDEEQQRTIRAERFGVRVPIEVYERVKADKLDNNLIDDVVFGHKRRGARTPEFRFPVAGGYITEW